MMGLEVSNLNVKVDDFTLQNINFQLESGYLMGLIGLNGAGKTTLLQTILGIYRRESGEIRIDNYDLGENTLQYKNELAFITDECLFPLELTPADIADCFGKMYTEFQKDKMKELCQRFQIPFHKSLLKMSKGMVIKVQLAFALARNATLYIMDEPTAGLDPIFRKEFLDYIFEILEEQNRNVILSTNITEELDKVADYILYLEKGKQKLFLSTEELKDNYKIIRGSENQIRYYQRYAIGTRVTPNCSEALVTGIDEFPVAVTVSAPTIEDIMFYFKKEGEKR